MFASMWSSCQAIGGPAAAPPLEECEGPVYCPVGWTLAGGSCYFLSTDYIQTFTAAAQFCENLGSTLVEVNSEAENAVVVAMAEAALTIDNNIGRDFWMGGVRTEDGTWRWQSGAPMDYTNWCENCPDVKNWACSQLLKEGYPAGTLDTFYWARNYCYRSDNMPHDDGVICEINANK